MIKQTLLRLFCSFVQGVSKVEEHEATCFSEVSHEQLAKTSRDDAICWGHCDQMAPEVKSGRSSATCYVRNPVRPAYEGRQSDGKQERKAPIFAKGSLPTFRPGEVGFFAMQANLCPIGWPEKVAFCEFEPILLEKEIFRPPD